VIQYEPHKSRAAMLLAAAAIGFLTPQSAAAEFDTSNTASQTASNTATGSWRRWRRWRSGRKRKY
jgi:hypothetical protein